MDKTKKKSKVLLLLAIFCGILVFGYFKYNSYIQNPMDPSDNTDISFQIKKGQTAKEIAGKLEEKELIKSPLSFYIYVRIHDLGKDIISGRFILNKTMNTPEILKTISDPKKAEAILTIQEGLTINDIEEKLIELDLAEKGEIINEVKNFVGWEYYDFLDKKTLENLELPLEGYIYPDTYFLNFADFSLHDILYLALDNFEKKWMNIDKNLEGSKLNNYSTHEIVTMASIIENEVFGEKNRKTVSGILWKRLENDWPLGADATLLYITDDREITSEDLNIDSPYNTRKFKGLPPGPISNPSLESIKAALYPQESNYWFYLTTPDTGEVVYSTTNEEHNQNRQKYLN